MRSDRVCNGNIGVARLTPGDAFIPTRSLSLPSRPYRESGQARVRSGVRPQLRDAAVTPPVTPAWLQSPEQLRRPGDFRSYCRAPARLWPPEPSTDSLKLTHNRPALGARLFQTGALPTHRCPDKPGKRGKRSETVPVAAGSVNRHRLLQVLSLPASQGRCNKRPGSVFPPHHRRCQESAS